MPVNSEEYKFFSTVQMYVWSFLQYIHLHISVCVVLQYLSEIQHLNLGYNQIECIPVPPAQGGVTTFQNMTTLILKNNNLQNLKGLFDKVC